MEDLFGINTRRAAVQQNIEKGFNGGTNLNEELEKARSGIYADTAKNRRLNRVGQHYGSKKQEDEPESKPKGKGEEEPKGGSSSEGKKDMSSHAAKASDGALKRAADDEKASEEVRNAAKQELEKRGKGDDKKWKSVFDKMKKVNDSFTEEMFDDLWELGQKHNVDLSDYGDEDEMDEVIKKKLPIKEVEKIVDSYSKGKVIDGKGNDSKNKNESSDKVDNSKGNKKAWKSVFNKLRHAESSDMYDNLWELGQKYNVDLDDYGDEEEMQEVIKKKIPYHEVANVINGGNDEKQWNSIFKKWKHAGDFSDDIFDDLWELGQKYGVDLSDYGDEDEMDEVIKNNIPIKEVQKVISKYKRTV